MKFVKSNKSLKNRIYSVLTVLPKPIVYVLPEKIEQFITFPKCLQKQSNKSKLPVPVCPYANTVLWKPSTTLLTIGCTKSA